ncbi:Major facilitator superfamily (MFS) profile domain-containing protein [Plasmodiophora brassicae]
MAVVSKTKNDEAGADGKLPWAMQILPCLIQANVGIQIQIMSPLFVPMARQFSSDVVQQNSMVNARPSLSSCAGLTTRPQVVTLNALYYWICGFSGLLWGWVADRFGRRVALLGGLVATTLAMAMMSVSTTYGMAIAARIVMGFDANLGINKAYVGDLVKGKNAGRLFSNMMSSLSIGFALGPLIASRLPGLVIPGTNSFAPAFWSCFIAGAFSLVLLVVCFFVLPETDAFTNMSNEQTSYSDIELEPGSSKTKMGAADATGEGVLKRVVRLAGTWRDELLMIALYCMVSGIVYSTDNLFILIVTGESELNQERSVQADIMLVQNIVRAAFTFAVQPLIISRLGVIRCTQVGMLVLGAAVPLIYVPVVVKSVVAMYALASLRGMVVAVVFTTSIMLVNNSTVPDRKGFVSGSSQTLVSLSRAASISGLAAVYTRCPGNTWVPFVAMGITSVCVAAIALAIPSRFRKPKA